MHSSVDEGLVKYDFNLRKGIVLFGVCLRRVDGTSVPNAKVAYVPTDTRSATDVTV